MAEQERAAAGERQIVVFVLGGEVYGVDIGVVREIITMQKITPLPGTADYVQGIINLRGKVIPVVDLKRRIGLAAGGAGADGRIMVVDCADGMSGFMVDEVLEVLTVDRGTIEAPQTTAGAATPAYVDGIVKLPERLVTLVNLQVALAA